MVWYQPGTTTGLRSRRRYGLVPAWDQYWTEEKEEVWFGTSLGPVLEEKEEVWFGTSLGPVLEEREDGSCTSVVPAVLVSRPKDTGRIM